MFKQSWVLALVVAALSGSASAQTGQDRIPKRDNPYFDNADNSKIIGGVPAPPGSYPWQVSMQRSDNHSHFCGGSVLNDRSIVTAAHCVVKLRPTDVHVVAGTHVQTAASPRARVRQIVIHKQYQAKSWDYDVAVVVLENPLALGTAIQPIRPIIDAEELVLGETPLFVAGWGVTSEAGQTVSTLREISVPLVPTVDCNDPLSYRGAVTDRMLCAGLALGGGKDSCEGDSGGPLATRRSGSEARLVGIVSWGEGCAKPGKPGVYARVSKFNAWITACVASPSTCN